MGVPPSGGVGETIKDGGYGVSDTWENLSRHFEKYLYAMYLQLTEYVGITIFLL